jgi:hypothetical protein
MTITCVIRYQEERNFVEVVDGTFEQPAAFTEPR